MNTPERPPIPRALQTTIPTLEVTHLPRGSQQYSDFLAELRRPPLARQLWLDAEHDVGADDFDHPDKIFTVVSVLDPDTDGWVPAAWCAARAVVENGRPVLRCTDGYERDGVGRVLGLYQVAFRARHADLVIPAGYPAVTVIFDQPLALHLAYGWELTGVDGTSELGHHWQELRRP